MRSSFLRRKFLKSQKELYKSKRPLTFQRQTGDWAMVKASLEFQVFAKPVGSICNLGCSYCYYLKKEHFYPKSEPFTMPDDLLEEYIVQHIDASPGPVATFSWHGGEPTVLGLDYFRKIVALQRKHQPPGCRLVNGIQTNGTLLDEDWCRFLAAEGFAVGLSLDGPQELHDRYRVTKGQEPTHAQAMRGYELLRHHRVYCDILCVVHAENVRYPSRVYRFFKEIEAQYLGFLPLVEPHTETRAGVSNRTVPAEAFGDFLTAIFNEWMSTDIGRVKVQIFEELAGTALACPLLNSFAVWFDDLGDNPSRPYVNFYISNLVTTPWSFLAGSL